MNLTDVLPCTAEELFKIQHEATVESKETFQGRKARLKPFSDAFIMCVKKCGPCTNDIQSEYSIHMAAIALLDILIEAYTKRHAI